MKFRYDKDTEELVVSEASRVEYHQIDLWLTRKVKGWKFQPAVKMGVWDGNKTYFKNGRVNLGLWKEVIRGCKEIDTSFHIENKEDFPINREVTLEKVQEFCKEFFKNHKVRKDGEWISFMPYDHQIEAAYKILKNRFCMAEVATSGGKSLIISIVMFYTLKNINKDAKFLIIVPSITLVTQFYDNILEYNHGLNNLVDMRDGKINSLLNGEKYIPCDIRVEEVMSDRPRKFSGTENPNVYIGTYQSLEKWPKKFFQQFHTVITDECLHPDSLINMSDGSLKKISDIKIGEYVKTINETTKEIEDKKVEYVYENLSISNDMYEIEMEDGKILKITGNHKVYTKEYIWKKVENLSENDEIIDFNFNI